MAADRTAELVESLAWFSPPSGDDLGTGRLNLCYNALDRHVVAGHAERAAVDVAGSQPISYARLLEEVAAWGGALLVLGIADREVVEVRLPPGREALIALLAGLRVGVPTRRLDAPDPSEGREGDEPIDAGDATWQDGLAAGRFEPAGCASLASGRPALPGVSQLELASAALGGASAVMEARLLGPLLRGRTLRLGPDGHPLP